MVYPGLFLMKILISRITYTISTTVSDMVVFAWQYDRVISHDLFNTTPSWTVDDFI